MRFNIVGFFIIPKTIYSMMNHKTEEGKTIESPLSF